MAIVPGYLPAPYRILGYNQSMDRTDERSDGTGEPRVVLAWGGAPLPLAAARYAAAAPLTYPRPSVAHTLPPVVVPPVSLPPVASVPPVTVPPLAAAAPVPDTTVLVNVTPKVVLRPPPRPMPAWDYPAAKVIAPPEPPRQILPAEATPAAFVIAEPALADPAADLDRPPQPLISVAGRAPEDNALVAQTPLETHAAAATIAAFAPLPSIPASIDVATFSAAGMSHDPIAAESQPEYLSRLSVAVAEAKAGAGPSLRQEPPPSLIANAPVTARQVMPEFTEQQTPARAPPPAPRTAVGQDLPFDKVLRAEPLGPRPAKPAPVLREPLTPRLTRTVAKIAKAVAYVFAGYLAVVLGLIVIYRFVDPPVSSLILQQRLSGQDIIQDWVPMEAISPQIVRAVMLSEDGRFCQHHGIDLLEMQAAIERAQDGIPRGASTISMQVTKNLFLWPSKSYIRKAIEIPLTLAIELLWPKRRIMEVYLNIAEWGPGIFGVEAASRFHFDKAASRLNEREAAQLAVALPNPYARDAGDPGPRTQRLAGDIQGRMRGASPSQTACVLGHRRGG